MDYIEKNNIQSNDLISKDQMVDQSIDEAEIN